METKPDSAPDVAASKAGKDKDAGMTPAKVAQILGGKITVLQPIKGKDGERDKTRVVERNLRADDILSFSVEGKKLVAVTADGRRRTAEL